MKKYILVLGLLLLFSFNALAFEYRGVKSGMTKAEVSEVIGVELNPDNSYHTLSDEEVKIWLPNIYLYEVKFRFTQDDKLWRIIISTSRGSVTSSPGKKKALSKVCDSVDESTTQIGVGTYSYNVDSYDCFLIDSKLFNQDVNYWENYFTEIWK